MTEGGVVSRFGAVGSVVDEVLAPPSPGLLALEGRTGLEFLAFLSSLPLLERLPRGDGHPVLILPGWMASDTSTLTLRWFLRRRGYHVHGWRLGRNFGPSPELIQDLSGRFVALRRRHGRKVTILGWSLGGIYARELARAFPDDVRQVITLVSPFRDPMATNAVGLFRRTRLGRRSVYDRASPLPVPATSLYSRTDGIVAWRSCLEPDGPRAENLAVVSSHVGIGHHPVALWVIADRLAQPEGAWAPFRRSFWNRWLVGGLAPADAAG
ncbi:MAG: esterase/lipase family protein [Candidatus Binatia bacterium]